MNKCLVCFEPTKYTYCSLSCSNTGRLTKNKEKYLLNPKCCPGCNQPIDYEKRLDNKYCSHSCAAKISNASRTRKEKLTKPTAHDKALKRFQEGLIEHRFTIRKCLIDTAGNTCSICGIVNVWQNKNLVLVVDHIDGNASNNMPTNLRLLCPNCNSQTDTFCGRNKGKGRGARGLSLH
jgi:5-methylcytosine-specific restriction endonuclease McrA